MADPKKLEPPIKEDFLNWRSEYVTKFFLQEIFAKRELIKEGIADGQTSTHDELMTMIGRTQSIKDVINYALFEFEYIDVNQPKEENT